MLRFKQFIIESAARADAATKLNARGTMSEYAVMHSINDYVERRKQGHSHEQALELMKNNLPSIHQKTLNTPEVSRDEHALTDEDKEQTIKDSHKAAADIIHHIHSTVGPISGNAIDTGKMTAQTIKNNFGQSSSADVLIPVQSTRYKHYGLSLKYGAGGKDTSAVKLNTPGHGVTHEHIQQLHQAVFGNRDSHLDNLWGSFSGKLQKADYSPESEQILGHLRSQFKLKNPSKSMPSKASLLRKAGRGALDSKRKSFKFDMKQPHLPAQTEEGEKARKAYQEEYAVKQDPHFKEYSQHMNDTLNKVFDHVKSSGNPDHQKAVHQFVSNITNIPLEEPTIKTELAHIKRDATTPTTPVHLTTKLNQHLSDTGSDFASSVKSHTINILAKGKKLFSLGRSDPKRGNPVTSTSLSKGS